MFDIESIYNENVAEFEIGTRISCDAPASSDPPVMRTLDPQKSVP